jgi:hypothetical protein
MCKGWQVDAFDQGLNLNNSCGLPKYPSIRSTAILIPFSVLILSPSDDELFMIDSFRVASWMALARFVADKFFREMGFGLQPS